MLKIPFMGLCHTCRRLHCLFIYFEKSLQTKLFRMAFKGMQISEICLIYSL